MALKAELIYAAARVGIPAMSMYEMELWELAAALGVHRIETREQHDTREIVETKEQYWEETGAERMERIAKVAEERRARAIEKKRQKAAG